MRPSTAEASTSNASFVLVQHWSSSNFTTQLQGNAMTHHNQQWCKKSRCCAFFTFQTERADDVDGVPAQWAKVRIVSALLRRYERTIVYLDTDAFMNDQAWCPVFDRGVGMLVAPDPQPWVEELNSGFFAVSASAVGRTVIDAWWTAFEHNASACWSAGGVCEDCGRDYRACHGRPCIWGGNCSDQWLLIHEVYPSHRRRIKVFPPSFQSTDATCSHGTVKHFAGGWHAIKQRAASTLAKCSTPARNTSKGIVPSLSYY